MIWLGGPKPALALQCVGPEEVIKKMDLIVRGDVVAMPQPGQVELNINRWYRGEQVTTRLVGEVGSGQRMDWERAPKVGDRLLIGFRSQEGKLVNGPCDLFVFTGPGGEADPKLLLLLGPGQAVDGNPETGAPIQPAPDQRPPIMPTSTVSGSGNPWRIGAGAAGAALLVGLAWAIRTKRM